MTSATLRCAIYSRVSSDERLCQDFNSLDAQRESCAAYIASQRHEGWSLVDKRYDDGGFSGGLLMRPALQDMLADIANGRIDIVVVYKIDRLTRSLADFAKIVDTLDAQSASFVAVTQSFNTTSSMGRLTLNVLLSFAQFERELAGERIRDKFAASKARGMWLGGCPPLGYQAIDRKLVPIKSEADQVQEIFQKCLDAPSVAVLAEQLAASGMRTKRHVRKDGRTWGDNPISRGMLLCVLRNPVYIGKIRHGRKVYEGQHDAILEAELWQAVQNRLDKIVIRHMPRTRRFMPSLLRGLLEDQHGRPMTPTFVSKASKRYRYYMTSPAYLRGKPPTRVPAFDVEQIIVDRVDAWLMDIGALSRDVSLSEANARFQHARTLRAVLCGRDKFASFNLFRELVTRVRLGPDEVEVDVKMAQSLSSPHLELSATLTSTVAKVRVGKETKLIVGAGNTAPPRHDPKLINVIVKAYRARKLLEDGRTMLEIAGVLKVSQIQAARLVRLSYFAPQISLAILNGHQPLGLTGSMLTLAVEMPLDWEGQCRILNFSYQ
jgi:site-specific DNA recombinase